MTDQPQQHGVGGVDYPTFFEQAEVDPAVKIKWLLGWRLRAVETIQHQQAEIDRLRARCASLEAVIRQLIAVAQDDNGTEGNDDWNDAFTDARVVLDQHATTTQEGTE